MDTNTAPNEKRAPILAESRTPLSGVKATAAMNKETVNPIAATKPIMSKSIIRIPSGKPRRIGFAASQPKNRIPKGLPTRRPIRTRSPISIIRLHQ